MGGLTTNAIMITAGLFVLVTVLFVAFLITKQGRPANYPPGPKWWPFLGNGLLLRKLAKTLNGQHHALSHLAKAYDTNLLGMKLGGELVVVGFGPSVVKDIMSRDEFVGRPDSFFLRLRCFGKRQGVTTCDGPLWQTQRAFVVRQLKAFGLGKTAMEDLIHDELRSLIELLDNEKETVNLGDILAPSMMSVLWSFVAGKRLQRTDEKLLKMLRLMNERSRAFDIAGGGLNQFPWIRFITPEKCGYTLVKALNRELKQFLTDLVEEHQRTYTPGVTRDLIDAYLHEMYERADEEDSTFTESQLIVVLLDLFIAGAQTTSNTLDFAFLYMIKYPQVQENVYQSLREVVQKGDLPKLGDKSRLAYVEAVIAEVQRMCNVVPVSGPRRTIKPVNMNGYTIPKDATILISLWSVHMDEKLFPEPQTFLPERFLGADGNYIRTSNFLPFGLGKRRCLGDILAKSYIFLIFSGILRHFKISKPDNDPEPTLEALCGITLAPKRYSAVFTPR